MNPRHAQNTNQSIHIHGGTVHHLETITPGMTLACDEGLVWLTESDNPQDYMLRPGHRMVIRRRGEVLIEALRDATVSVIYPN